MWWSRRSSSRPSQGMGAGSWNRRKRISVEAPPETSDSESSRLAEETPVVPAVVVAQEEVEALPSLAAMVRLEDEPLPLPLSLAVPSVIRPTAWLSAQAPAFLRAFEPEPEPEPEPESARASSTETE